MVASGRSGRSGPSGASLARLGLLLVVCGAVMLAEVQAQKGVLTPKAPNFQYFERPKYRYPFYDEKGRGKLLYGYGGSDLYQYKTYSPLEGIH